MEQAETNPTIASAIDDYIELVKLTRSENTGLAYGKALKEFKKIIAKEKIDPEISPSTALTEDLVHKFILYLQANAPTTEQLYLQALKGFYEYIDLKDLADINQSRVRVLIRQRSRRS